LASAGIGEVEAVPGDGEDRAVGVGRPERETDEQRPAEQVIVLQDADVPLLVGEVDGNIPREGRGENDGGDAEGEADGDEAGYEAHAGAPLCPRGRGLPHLTRGGIGPQCREDRLTTEFVTAIVDRGIRR